MIKLVFNYESATDPETGLTVVRETCSGWPHEERIFIAQSLEEAELAIAERRKHIEECAREFFGEDNVLMTDKDVQGTYVHEAGHC